MPTFRSYNHRIRSYIAWRKGKLQEARYNRLSSEPIPAKRPEKPISSDLTNVVLLVLDSVRADSFSTENCPNIMRLCKSGMNFSQAYATANWTLPSHTSMLTGLLPSGHGAVRKEFMAYKPTKTYLPNMLRQLGYWCQAVVRMNWLHPKFGLGYAFDQFDQLSLADSAEIFSLCQPRQEPFFLFINLGDTHSPYVCPSSPERIGDSEDHSAYNHGKISFNDEYFQRLRSQQNICIKYVDSCLPALIEKLPDNTRYIITSDHGELFGEESQYGHSGIIHPAVLHVPLLTNFKVGCDCHEPTSLKEIYSLALGRPIQNGWAMAEHFSCPDFLQPKKAFKKSLAVFWQDNYLQWQQGIDWKKEQWERIESLAKRFPELLTQLAASFNKFNQQKYTNKLRLIR